jgi:multiple sugar transport system permease protein
MHTAYDERSPDPVGRPWRDMGAVAEAPVSPAGRPLRRAIPHGRGGSPVRRAENRAAYCFLLPWFIGLSGISVIPIAASLILSFTSFDVLSSPNWVGLENYEKLLTDDRRYMNTVWVTIKYVAYSVPMILVFSLAIAVMLNRGLAGLAIYRSLFYIPSLIGASVGIGILWREVFGERGVFNHFLALFGIEGRGWISHPLYALDVVIALHVWTFGASMVIFLAALRQIPESYYEAAAIDGANVWQRFRRITLPLLTPVIFFNMVLLTIGSFQSFTQAFVVSRGTGGPIDSTLLYTLYLYQRAFVHLDMGYASAMAWLLLLAIGGLTAFIFWTARYWVFYGDR